MATQKEMKSKRTKLVEKFISPENHTERIADLYDTFDVLDTALCKAEERIYKLEVRLFGLAIYSIVVTILFILI